jgi:hypothetical protein
MKRLLIAAAITLLAITANAETFIPSGAWATFQTVTSEGKKPVCGMQTVFRTDNATIMIKYVLGNKGLLVHIFKDSWRFPATGSVDIPISIQFDRNTPGRLVAEGGRGVDGNGVLEFKIGEGLDLFLREFAEADLMLIDFPQGDEPRWAARMVGSRKAALMFKQCIFSIIEQAERAGSKPTQPYGGGPTQPYGARKTPTQPVKQPTEDDGSI